MALHAPNLFPKIDTPPLAPVVTSAYSICMSKTSQQIETIQVGDRVETVGCGAEDSDAGVVHGIVDAETVRVGWDSGVVTLVAIASIRIDE